MPNIHTFTASIVDKLGSQFLELNTCVALPCYLETTDLSVIHANTPGVFVPRWGPVKSWGLKPARVTSPCNWWPICWWSIAIPFSGNKLRRDS